MMNDRVVHIKKLVRAGEGQYIEFKKKVNHPEKIVREVVAFANSDGGNLLIGVDDNGTVSGLKYPEDEEYEMSKAIRELCRPQINFEVAIVKVKEDVEILHYQIQAGEKKPYFAFLQKNHRTGRSFVRVDDHSIQASYEVRQILKRQERESHPVHIDEATKVLLTYLADHRFITQAQYHTISGFDQKIASSKLIDLTLSGVLKVTPKEGGDHFELAQ